MDIAVEPEILKDVDFTVDADNYAAHCSTVTLVPSVETTVKKWKGLTPTATKTDATVQPSEWVATVSLAQDWTTPNSLASYLFDHEGETKTVVFQPLPGSGQAIFTVDLIIVPPQVGGDVDEFMVANVSMPCAAKPVKTVSV